MWIGRVELSLVLESMVRPELGRRPWGDQHASWEWEQGAGRTPQAQH